MRLGLRAALLALFWVSACNNGGGQTVQGTPDEKVGMPHAERPPLTRPLASYPLRKQFA